MKKHTTKELVNAGYTIENALISSVDISMEDYGCVVYKIVLKGGGWGCVFGGYCLDHGYLGATDFDGSEFDGSEKGIESIARIMDAVGVSRFNDMKGRYIRVATKGWGEPIKIIGNIVREKCFDSEAFFSDVN